MARYARIVDGRVAEIIVPPEGVDLREMFHPDIVANCAELSGADAAHVQAGWSRSGNSFLPPEAPQVGPAPEPTVEELMARIRAKQIELEALIAQLPAN